MKPLDPRLLRHARSARRYIVTTAVTGTLTALLVVAQAHLISRAVAPMVTGSPAARPAAGLLGALALVLAGRALVLLLQERQAHRAATGTVIELRRQVLEHAGALGPRWQAIHGPSTATLLTRGLEDLQPYFTRYLPQLLLAATVTPMTALVMLVQDVPSTVAVAVTVPLIPVFMVLIGRLTQRHSEERLAAMDRLGAQVLDLLAGLPTLKALGREQGPGRRVAALGRAYNATTMQTLKVAFLSGAVLEFITTLSVAIIAVEVGFRLLYGRMDLATGLLVIMIAPEVYQPLRQVGFHFHASANGVAAAQAVFEVLDTPRPERGALPAPDLRGAVIEIEDLWVRARGTWAPAALSAAISPGRLVALTGPSGAGKTTTALVLLSLLPANRGAVRVRTPDGSRTDLADIDPASWWRQVSWVPQRPVIVPGTIADNVLGPERAARCAEEPPAALLEAARATGLDEVVDVLPQGWLTPVGQAGAGLSVGQRQRLALTRALVDSTPLVVLDEPTAHLDAASEAHVLAGVEALRAAGRTVVVVAHRQALIARADDVVAVSSTPVDRPEGGAEPPVLVAPRAQVEGAGR
ncbi:MAG: thiol reductant ABC exporter subunit CydD [Actinomyces sp.]|uniref:thiol reductant ABC exporter subunit CydD n=1 Tax=Actinomyces sp. TaxID=29317 RepID=UPI0026DB8497|nr:thiol reductant ABC exporter subunit CydD [Actinomyces sp.]MDO4242656.1 thiol reductant ABC exporter subunit CydD [Actinomyces sp.]